MARPTKAVGALSDYSQTKDEIKARAEAEKKLAMTGIPKPPDFLTSEQRDIFESIVTFLSKGDIIALNDVWILQEAAITIDRITEIERMTNLNKDLITDSGVQGEKHKLMSDFFRCCNELCLSPQARAKIANTATAATKKNPLESLVEDFNKEG